MSLNLFIIGPSGCGKSTQAKLIAQKYNLSHFSTGQLLRDEMAAQTQLGKDAKSYLDAGNLVPDDIVFAVLIAKLNTIGNQNFIIDGFPRLLNQGIYIEKYLENKLKPIDLIIHLDVSVDEIQKRRQSLKQSFQDASRTDNTPAAITARQKYYDDNNGPIMEHFRAKGELLRIDGNRQVEPIFAEIARNIDKITL